MNNPEAFKEDEVRSIKFIVPGLPFGKQRPKVTVRKFTGSDGKEKKFAKAYTPKKTVNYENLVKMAYQEKAKGKKFKDEDMLDVRIIAYYNMDEVAKIQIIRHKAVVLEFRIRPLSEDEYVKIKKRNTNYKKNKANGLRIAESVDSADYRSELIYEATIEEDRTKIWDRTDAWEKCNVVNGIGLIDVVLKAGEKDAILEKLDEISGFTPSMEDVAKN